MASATINGICHCYNWGRLMFHIIALISNCHYTSVLLASLISHSDYIIWLDWLALPSSTFEWSLEGSCREKGELFTWSLFTWCLYYYAYYFMRVEYVGTRSVNVLLICWSVGCLPLSVSLMIILLKIVILFLATKQMFHSSLTCGVVLASSSVSNDLLRYLTQPLTPSEQLTMLE